MARIVIELTNRCNLRCQHCFEERHAATGDLPLEIIDKVLREGSRCGIDQLAFNGGEPTIHRQFAEIIRRVAAAGYPFSFVSNGMNFAHIYPLLVAYRTEFQGVAFSLDGAREATHDRLRGSGSYRRVMQAASICVVKDLPFTLNMVLTAHNHPEVEEMVWLAGRLGSQGVRFGYLMPTPETALRGLDLAPQARRTVETQIRRLQKRAAVYVGMAPGYFHAAPFFPCAPLELEEFNLDYRGNLTLCCQLSGYSGATAGTDLMGNLHDVSLDAACDRFRQRVATYLADKRERVSQGALDELDYFPCWYCVKYLDKVPWLTHVPQHPWAQGSGKRMARRSNAHAGPQGTSSS